MARQDAWTLAALLLFAALHAAPAAAHGTDGTGTAAAGQGRQLWGCPMDEAVRLEAPGVCPRCGMDLIELAVLEDLRGEPPRCLMPGVPNWLVIVIGLVILVVSFVLFELTGGEPSGTGKASRFDLLGLPGLRRLLARRSIQVTAQAATVLLFALVIFAGLAGTPAAERNIATILTWTIWWTWLALVVVAAGKLWCTVCPWMALADWIARLGSRLRGGGRFGLSLPWPRRLRNIWAATALFVFLTWLELGYGVTLSPRLTALLALGMVALAVLSVVTFERKALCRYACLVGRVSGLYSLFAATELRPLDAAACRSCAGKDCFHGNERGDPCPTHQYLGAMAVNTYCTLCLECLRTCPKGNVAWNLRPPGADLVESTRTRADEAYLAVIMLSMSAFHGLTMTPSWDTLVNSIDRALGLGRLAAFSLGMALMLALPLALYYGVCCLVRLLSGERRYGVRFLFVRFAYSLLPIALFYHIAHNLQHIIFEGKKLLRVSSDPFGWGWDLFGTARITIDAVLPVEAAWTIQLTLILVGHVFGILIAHRAAVALYGRHRRATLSQLPLLVAMLLFSFQSLWLLAQPMVMRSSM